MNLVICVNNRNWETLPLTIGKIYEVIEKMNIPYSPSRWDDSSGPFYKIKCDTGEVKYFDAPNFRNLTLAERRQLKLADLLPIIK